jgi:hypothetical protein
MRTPRWELHIKPMFALPDSDHMGFRFDLTDVNSVWSFRQPILMRLKSTSSMPPQAEHGPWPEEWIALFERWITAGETEFGGMPPRLTVGQGSGYQLTAGFVGLRLSGTARLPSSDSKTWLHLSAVSETSQTLTLYIETPPSPSGTAVDRPVVAKINAPPSLREVVVIDASGETRLPRPGS